MKRVDIDNLLRIGLIVILVSSGAIATDWTALNATFVPIHNTTHRLIPTSIQYTDNFESNYRGNRAEDMDLLAASEVWNGGLGAGTSFTLELPTTEGNEWMTSSTGLFNDSVDDTYAAVYRNGMLYDVDGSADDADWLELEFYNATGAGFAGCIFVLSGETGNPNAFVIVNGDKIYAYDDSTPVEIGDNTQEVWHTLRITSEMPTQFYTTLDGTTTGPYTLYNNINWDFNEDGYSTGLTGGLSTGAGVADTCVVWLDNITDSWSTTEEILFNATSNVFDDIPVLEIKGGSNAQLYMPNILTYSEQGEYGVCINDESGGLGYCTGVGVPNHNDLTSLQGGGGGEYYHLTSEEYDDLGNYSSFANYSIWAEGLIGGVAGDGAYNITYHNTTTWVIESSTEWLNTFNQTYHDTTQKVNNNEATYNSTYNATYHALVSNGLAYALNIGAGSQATMTDAQILYWSGMYSIAPSTTADNTRVYIPVTSTIKGAYIFAQCTTAGTAETWGMYFKINNGATNNWIINITVGNNRRVWSNNTINIEVNQGDYIEIREVQPTWATNPATCRRSGVIYLG